MLTKVWGQIVSYLIIPNSTQVVKLHVQEGQLVPQGGESWG